MMSQAQAESESMSGNIRWGHRKNFKDGKVYFHYAGFLAIAEARTICLKSTRRKRKSSAGFFHGI